MTLIEVSAADKYSVSTVQKTVQDERGLYPSRAHHSDHPYIRRILHPAHTRCVSSSVTAPVTEEAEYSWFVFHTLTPNLFMTSSPLMSPLLYKEGVGEVEVNYLPFILYPSKSPLIKGRLLQLLALPFFH